MKPISISSSIALLLGVLALTSVSEAKPRHQSHSKVKHVLMLSIDGLRQKDLAGFVASNPKSNLAGLVNTGIQFSNAQASKPSDSFPGLLAQLTGGSPATTGVWYDDSYDRSLYPPGSNCFGPIGTEVLYDETIDIDDTKINGGGGINVQALPLRLTNGKCEPVWPHQYVRVNNIFEIARKHGHITAWSDKHTGAYDIVRGPSGNGLTDYYSPENSSVASNATAAYDDLHVNAVVNWIQGKDATGTKRIGIPSIMGCTFQAINTNQKAFGTPSAQLNAAFQHTDAALGKIVASLKAAKIYQNTVIIVSAKHGQSPIDARKLKRVDPSSLPTVLGVDIAHQITDDAGIFWLKDSADTFKAASNAYKNADQVHLTALWAGEGIRLAGLGDPATDPRVPDIIFQSEPGTLFSLSKKKIAEHGGFNEDDVHVALLISSPYLRKQVNTSPVKTTQIAPTILRLLDLNPAELEAVQIEGTCALPIA
ncbi:type I phosphodiesterase/nucleotide pyrophosphatase [Gamsiella multidivaricata]|uniref:type I phosphodiesterase/nucleotide pyrophosphatase n=1 Tax=Gamsiella multidivaricata TaxID=101098 RepID=UPI00221F0094|nr:type I phosphodiesterase/nucleotide pyrophosphatase [Gamsiella multidivaricata]KAG0366335.1 hypothetical protein BGZ54_005514 [Gamsiella multidivaricata]KAI7823850.1 type I phosphodiesterase/nucleotide pyrophosphatase [Gamsiella multidivaricata]